MKTLVTFLKISFLCVINIIIWQQSIFSTVRPDEITTVTLPSIETGIIPEDIIYIEEFNRFYIFGNNKLIIIEYSTTESKYVISGSICLFGTLLQDCDRYGNNIYPKKNITNETPKNKYLAYDPDNKNLYVLRPDFRIVQIDIINNVNNGVKISALPAFQPFAFETSKIYIRNGILYWQQYGQWGDPPTKKQFFGSYNINDEFSQIINNYTDYQASILDFVVDDNFIYLLYNPGTGSQIQRRYISSFAVYGTTITANFQLGEFYYGSNNRIYVYGFGPGAGKVYVIDPTDLTSTLSPEIIDHYNNMEIPPISCATYDNINHFLYLGTCYSAGQDDIFIYNYDINVDEHNYINKLATNNIPSKSENKPYYLFCANEKAYASKESEIVRIDYKGDYKFESSQVIEKVNNYFYTCALDEQLDNVLALNLEGVIHVIDNTGQYFDNPDIQVGIKVNDAYHIPFKDIVCFYTRDLFQDNHLVVYDNHSKVIIADIKNEHPISDVIYNPFTSEILVSYYSGEVNYLSRYSYTPPATINEEKVYFQNSNDNYCGKIFIDPNHHLYCAVGLDNINDAKILFINADNYSQINSFALNGVTNLTDFKVSFTYHKPNSFVYSTIMQFSDDFNYSDIVEINPSGIGSLIHLISQHDLPVKIESCPVHNKLYVQYMNDNHITRIKWIDNTIDYFDDFNLPNVCILDIAYDDHLDFLYFTNGFSQTGFIYCDLDIFNEERVFDNGHSYYPIIFNKKNNFLYSYCPNDHPARINKLMSSEPLFWSESNVITLNNTINRKSEIGYMNTLSVDDYKNFLFIPNGSQCNFTVVRCTPERRYLGQGIPNPYEPFNYNYISFPSLERLEGVEDNPVSAIDVLSKFEPFTESPVITMEGRVPGNSEPYTIYHPHDGEWSGTLTDVFSSRGYALQHNVPSGQVCYIPMEGMRLDPGYDQIKLYYGANIENWTGYFIDETQNIFNALGEVEQDLNLIIAQCWACTRQFWSGDPGINQSWMCRTAIGAENIPVGGISYGTMVRLTLKPNVPFRTFGWSSGQEPYPIITKSDPVHFIFNSNSLYTPIFIELDTSARPLEIGAFIGNTCIGATTVNLDDTIIMVPAYNNGDTTSIIEFEEYFGDLKSPNRNRIINYRSFNSKINKITDNTIRICSPENGAYFVSLKKEDIIEEQNIQTSFMCYPNPYQAGSLTLTANLDSASDIQIEIFDARSRLCAFYEIGDQPSGLFNCNLENLEISAQLSPGIYLVKMKTGVRELYTKLIIR